MEAGSVRCGDRTAGHHFWQFTATPASMAIMFACFIAIRRVRSSCTRRLRCGISVGDRRLCLRLIPAGAADEEYKSTAGSAPMVRFILGAALMISALVFSAVRSAWYFAAASDLNAWVAYRLCRRGDRFVLPQEGFSLGRAYEVKPVGGAPVSARFCWRRCS